MLKVALFASQYLPHRGGVEEVVRQLSQRLRSYHFEPTVVVNRWPRNLPREQLIEGTRVIRPALRVATNSLKSKLTYHLTHQYITAQLIKLARRERFDLINVHCVSANAMYAMRVAKATNIPIVLNTHGELDADADGLFASPGWGQSLMKSSATHATKVLACSEHTLRRVREVLDIKLPEAQVIYNGVDIDEFQSMTERTVENKFILAIGRLVNQKAFDVLLRSISLSPNVQLKIAGNGPLLEELSALARQLGCESRVEFLGQCDRKRLTQLLSDCELVVVPSRVEPFGIVALEAMAAARMVIASRVGGLQEFVIDGVNGILVEPENVVALADAIQTHLADTCKRRRLAEAGHATAKAMSWERYAEKMAQVFREVLG